MLDVRENLLRISFTQIDAVTGSQVIRVEVTVTRSCFRGHPHEMPQHVWHLVAGWMQAGNFDLFLAGLAEPNKRMAIGGCGTGAKIHVIWPLRGNAGLSNRLHVCRR